MKLNLKRMIVALVVVVFLGTASGFAGSPASSTAAPETDHLATFLSGQASGLLAEVQHEAAGLVSNAQILGTLGTTITWHSHASYLIEDKKHINAIGVRL